MKNLFQLGDFKAASGKILPWKLECDALTNADWECLAFMIAERCGEFGSVFGIPTGGEPLAKALEQYITKDCVTRLLVDDVYTTGGSIEKYRQPFDMVWVVFARKRPTGGVKALFIMDDNLESLEAENAKLKEKLKRMTEISNSWEDMARDYYEQRYGSK